MCSLKYIVLYVCKYIHTHTHKPQWDYTVAACFVSKLCHGLLIMSIKVGDTIIFNGCFIFQYIHVYILLLLSVEILICFWLFWKIPIFFYIIMHESDCLRETLQSWRTSTIFLGAAHQQGFHCTCLNTALSFRHCGDHLFLVPAFN